MSASEIIAELPRLTPAELFAVGQRIAELTVLPAASGAETSAFSIEKGLDGLPLIRGRGGVITSALVQEIEGLGT